MFQGSVSRTLRINQERVITTEFVSCTPRRGEKLRVTLSDRMISERRRERTQSGEGREDRETGSPGSWGVLKRAWPFIIKRRRLFNQQRLQILYLSFSLKNSLMHKQKHT
jgi:hypothetical protein